MWNFLLGVMVGVISLYCIAEYIDWNAANRKDDDDDDEDEPGGG